LADQNPFSGGWNVVRDETITLRDRRTLAYTDLGPDARDVPVVVYLHGAPTSRLDLVDAAEHFRSRGVRVLSPDRPGYGRSSPHPGRTMTDHATDVASLADRLGIDSFFVVGLSSGGPYAVACAATLGARVRGAAIVAGATDFGWDGAWDGFVAEECEMMRLPDEAAVVRWCEERYGADGMGFLRGGADAASGADDTGAAGAAADAAPAPPPGGFVASMIEAFRQGVGGYAQDVWVQGHPWPFDPGAVTVPVHLFHGDADTVVPLAHAQHTASLVPGARLEVWPGESHRSAAARTPEVITTLFAP
jgi:pimeloyl-ACP methyl ester carboxylesterase